MADTPTEPIQMKVFIDNPAGMSTKNLYNEKTLEYLRSVTVSTPYPFPYGFFLNTTSGDGDNLDCFVITSKNIHQAEIVNVEPLGLMEVVENGEIDHKVIAQLVGEKIELSDTIKQTLIEFIQTVFSHLPEKHMSIGDFLPRESAIKAIRDAQDFDSAAPRDDSHYNEV